VSVGSTWGAAPGPCYTSGPCSGTAPLRFPPRFLPRVWREGLVWRGHKKMLALLPGSGAAGVWFQDDLLYHNSLFHCVAPSVACCGLRQRGAAPPLACRLGAPLPRVSASVASLAWPGEAVVQLPATSNLSWGHCLAGHCVGPWSGGCTMEEEIKAVKVVSRRLCPPLISLDRCCSQAQECCWRAGRYVGTCWAGWGCLRGSTKSLRACLPGLAPGHGHPSQGCVCAAPVLVCAPLAGLGRHGTLPSSEPCCAMPYPRLPRSKQ